MKVQAVNFYNLLQTYPVQKRQNIKECSAGKVLLASDIFIPSFSGIETFNPETIEGIHCARCGKVTLTQDKYNQILNDMQDARTGEDICRILENNKDFIRKGYDFIAENISLKTSPKISANSAIVFIYNDIGNIYAEKLDEGIDIMNDALKTPGLSDNNKEAITECINRIIKTGPDYKNYSAHYRIVIESFRKTDYKDRKILFSKAFMPAQRVYTFRKKMTEGGFGQVRDNELRELFTRTLFGNSVAKTVPVNKNGLADNPVNKVVVCQECETKCTHSKYFFSKADTYPIVKKSLLTYLRDLNMANKSGKIDIPNDYVFKVARYASYKEPSLALSATDTGILKYQQQHMTLPFEKLSDITCPGCGVRMLTFDEYGKLEKNIAKTNKLIDLTRLIYQNKANISPHIFHIAKEYCRFVKTNPRMSDKIVKRHMYEVVTNSNHNDIRQILNRINYILETNNGLTRTEKAELLRLYDKISGICDFTKPVEIIENMELEKFVENSDIIEPLDMFNLKYFILSKAESIKNKQYLVFPSKRMQAENKIWSEGFVKRLFKFSTFSTDHMQSRSRSGTDDSGNLIGLCKKCNQSKKNINFSDWYKNFVKTDSYIKSYLKKTKEYTDNGLVKGYENYSAQIAENIYILTDKAVDLRKEYPER